MTSPFVLPRTRVVAIAVAAALLALVAWQLGAARPANNAGAAVGGVHISLTVNGAKTGLFKGDDNSTSRTPGVITVLAYQYELQVPTSSSTAPATTCARTCPSSSARSSRGASLRTQTSSRI